MKLSIIIPVFNEAASLAQIVDYVYSVKIDIQKEVVISDDGSSDDTARIVRQLQQKYPDLVAFHAPTNLGKGAAVRAGIAVSTGELIIIQDADLELDPNDFPSLLAPILDQHAKIVYGSRFLKLKTKVNRASHLANRFLTFLTNLLFGGHLSDMETAYKLFPREALQGIHLRCVRFDFEPELTANFLKKGFQIVEVPISYHPRTIKAGKKISWLDGFEAIFTLIRCRLAP